MDTKTYDYNKIFYMPGALKYIKDLRAKGYHLGLLVNYPDEPQEAGLPDAERVKMKIKLMKEWLAPRWWVAEQGDPKELDWSDYDVGIRVPVWDKQRKPAPYLFEQAVKDAAAAGCKAIFEGEEKDETEAARRAGMYAYEVGATGEIYLPENKIADFVHGEPN